MRTPRRLPVVFPLLAVIACGPGAGPGPSSALGAEPDAATPPPDVPPEVPAGPPPLERALSAYDEGRLDEATVAAFEAMTAPPDPETIAAAQLVLARVAVAEGRWEEARIRLAAVRGGQAKYVPGYSELVDFLAADSDGTLAAAGDDERREAVRQLDDLTLLPGDTLRLEVTIEKLRGVFGRGRAVASVDGEIAVEATISFVIPRDQSIAGGLADG